jgi:prolyl 4-hydroxylase
VTMARMTERQQQQERGDDASWEDIHMKDYDDDDNDDDKGSQEDDDESSQETDQEDDDDDEEDDDDETSSLWTELANGWKQHILAVFVAIAATALAFSSQAQIPSSLLMQMAPTTSSSLSSSQRIHETHVHAHLKSYHRTANISFCGHGQGIVVVEEEDDDDESTATHTSTTTFEMRPMDFHIPKKLIPTLALHYAADLLQDDDYTSLLALDSNNNKNIEDHENPARILVRNHHAEYACLQQQQESAPKSYIKGVTKYYRTPTIASMYPDEIKRSQELSVKQKAISIQPATLSFTGFAAKFVNLSPKPVLLHWESTRDDKPRLVGEIAPFESIGTATTPGQSFSVSPVYDSAHALERWTVTADDAISTYAPVIVDLTKLSPVALAHYQMQLLNAEFAKHYLIHSGRVWLAHFPRAFPVHPMWEASYFGQQHSVAIAAPPVVNGDAVGDHQPRQKKYKLTVASVTPRVLTIPNFLSAQECQQLIELAQQQGLKGSTVFSGGNMTANRQREGSTRSSSNAWLARSSMNVTDRIYRRAAAVLQMDESLLQAPMGDDVHAHQHATAESLQIVKYKQGQSYSAHHDFVYPPVSHRLQPTRFATLLFYLNDDFEGGHTVFPRAVNAQHHDGVSIEPVRGTAVLFYSMLPDGNVDDLSQHGGEPVTSGEKFIGNFWIWDPAIN